jgi:hypothetical protein
MAGEFLRYFNEGVNINFIPVLDGNRTTGFIFFTPGAIETLVKKH